MTPEIFFRTMGALRGARSEQRLRHQMQLLYRNVAFKGKNVLDIGGGIGLHSFYALASGARSAIIVEPEGDGGHSETISTFTSLRDTFNVRNIDLVQITFQNYQAPSDGFDLVLIQDAINHFNEPACINLRKTQESREVYDDIFRGIAHLIKPDGYLIISDCSPINLYPALGMKNPFDPHIEWHKHQPPSVWAELARGHGLEQTDQRWSTPTRLGPIGQSLFGNAVAAWFFTSHFVTSFRKSRT